MRGKVIFGCFCRFPMRITPAYAGKRCKPEKRQDCRQDHPRLCGEKVPMAIKLYLLVGITPAYAGKRQRKHVRHAKPWDHPRLCGEKTVKSHRACQAVGSPPPMRGKVRTDRIATDRDRITPAYAGKSVWLHWSTGAGEDHPRLCGEKLCHFCKILFRPGSPPPMRGKGTDLTNCGYWKRITPAYAGKSLHLHHIYSFYQDHPRLCGEKPPFGRGGGVAAGSPPPMRGKDGHITTNKTPKGITPAYAGKSI